MAMTGVVLVGLHSCLTCSRGAAVGPFVRDCEAERLFLCCVVRVGYWPDQPIVCSRVLASFLSDSCFATCRGSFYSCEVCPGVGTVVTAIVACGVPEWWHSFIYRCRVRYPLRDLGPFAGDGSGYRALLGIDIQGRHSFLPMLVEGTP
ncbi:hypothetical protein Taro_015448 [Colocasia esculenta]|uniref:Secreted protein n=1 Tax=Colocasia esculenta TaxID=4460 RepID=A0A843UHJ1_COLES|nr:hypothetical protein [Colocasia esculenta]